MIGRGLGSRTADIAERKVKELTETKAKAEELAKKAG